MGKHLGVAYNLRLPQKLKDKIAESAKELNRSMNADIVARLEESFEGSTFTKEQKIEYGEGFLAGTVEALTALYSDLLGDLEKGYSNDPTPELFLEIEKYKFLIEKMNLLIHSKSKSLNTK
ncbi:Arc family DNA-binding protein [Acinetobacter johnsonii]|uniref:Arc family DNA-binding protein n=1 Tax=Acinetobacter johnsonii TaxID=40214 RepID=UPI0030B0E66E